jgi:hypothetical protein
MRKAVLAAIVMLGLAVPAGAQRPNFPPKPIQEIKATTMVSPNASITRLQGDVAITLPAAVVFASEATIDATTNQVDLRGKVRMTLAPVVTADARRQPFPKGIREMTAATGKSDGLLTQFNGGVTLVIEGAVVHADGATTNATTNEVELRGNVRMTLTPAPEPRSK